jgi:hypothetical protein
MSPSELNKSAGGTVVSLLRLMNLHHELRERGDELSVLAAGLIETLREKTAVHIGFTDDRTKERINLFAPDMRCFEIAVYDAEMNAELRRIHKQAETPVPITDLTAVDGSPQDIRAWLKGKDR